MVIYAVDIDRRVRVLRGTVFPMYVSHAPNKLVVQRSNRNGPASAAAGTPLHAM